ncbi:glutathione hydrolase 1 proenzyme-like [Amblyomma americanum]
MSTTSVGQANRLWRTGAGVMFAVVVVSLLTLNMVRAFKRQLGPLHLPPVSPTKMGVFSSWGIVGHRECASTTRNILRKNGTVGDVAVAVTLCMCVALPNRCGIGGGLFAIYYKAKTGRAVVIDGRETAPADTNWKVFDKKYKPSEAVYVGVPGQMIALETLLNLTGTAVPWADLFTDAINLAERGFPIGRELADIIASEVNMETSHLHDIFWRNGRPLKAGEVLVQRALAGTLRELAQKNASVYGGTLARALVKDLRAAGSHMTLEDLGTYRVNVTDPIHFPLAGGYTLLAPRPPAGGIYLGLVLSVLSRFVEQHHDSVLPDDGTTAHRLVEALKFAFGRRSVLGDPHYTDMDGVVAEAASPATGAKIARTIASHLGPSSEPRYYGSPFSGSLGAGTAHFGFLAPNGDAVVLSSSLNSMFGSAVLSTGTGVLFNDVMRDFDLPHGFDQYNLTRGLRNQVRRIRAL